MEQTLISTGEIPIYRNIPTDRHKPFYKALGIFINKDLNILISISITVSCLSVCLSVGYNLLSSEFAKKIPIHTTLEWENYQKAIKENISFSEALKVGINKITQTEETKEKVLKCMICGRELAQGEIEFIFLKGIDDYYRWLRREKPKGNYAIICKEKHDKYSTQKKVSMALEKMPDWEI